MEIVDDVYFNQYSGGDLGELIGYDAMSFMVDGDHSGGQYSILLTGTEAGNKLNWDRSAQLYRGVAETPDGRHVGYQGPGGDWVNAPPYTEAGGIVFGDGPALSIIEFSVTPFDDLIWDSPEESMPSEPSPGKIIGFDVAVRDFDSPDQIRGFYALSGNIASFFRANLMVDGILMPIGESFRKTRQ